MSSVFADTQRAIVLSLQWTRTNNEPRFDVSKRSNKYQRISLFSSDGSQTFDNPFTWIVNYLSLWFASEKANTKQRISIRLRLVRNSNYYRNLNIRQTDPFIQITLSLQNFNLEVIFPFSIKKWNNKINIIDQ